MQDYNVQINKRNRLSAQKQLRIYVVTLVLNSSNAISKNVFTTQ
jgi:hypothetical protein